MARADRGVLGLVAGAGALPGLVVAACRARGRPVFVLALEGYADPAVVEGVPHAWIRLGALGGGIDHLRRAEAVELVLAGGVRRPGLKDLLPDLRGARFLARVGLKALGDDGLLRAVVAELEDEGFRVIGAHELLGDALAVAGAYGRQEPDAEAWRDIRRGIAVARGLGALDVGQGAVVQQGLVLAVEAIEGTDAMLGRCRELARPGSGGVLVKVKKPGQDSRADLPAIGPDTVERAAAAGLAGIAIEAGGALVLDRDRVAQRADALGLFVVGVDAGTASGDGA